MEKKEGLAPSQERLLSILEYRKYTAIQREELISLISKYNVSKKPEYLIKSMLQKGRLVSFKRENYIVVPMRSVNKIVGISEFELNENFLEGEEHYIGLYNAFNLHGFTEQIPNKLFVFNSRYSFDKKILHYRFKYFKIRKDKFFGILKKYKYPYSDKERTIIDALDYPQYLGGLMSVIDNINKARYTKKKLIDYAIKYNSIKIMKLVGWLTNSREIFNLLKKKKALSYYSTIRKTGEKLLEKKWKIRMI